MSSCNMKLSILSILHCQQILLFVCLLVLTLAGAESESSASQTTQLHLCGGGNDLHCSWIIKRTHDADWSKIDDKYAADKKCVDTVDEKGPWLFWSASYKIKRGIQSTINMDVPKDIGFSKLFSSEGDPSVQVLLSLKPEHPHAESPLIKNRAAFTKKGTDIFCANRGHLRPEFRPLSGCPDEAPTSSRYPVIHAPWCGQWNTSVVIASVDCGIAEDGQSHQFTAWSLYSRHGVISAKDQKNYMDQTADGQYKALLRSKLDPKVSVKVVDEAAVVGYIEYPYGYGHFANEILPRLLFLDKMLPEHIPMFWPVSPIANEFKTLLQSHGILSHRKFLLKDYSDSIEKVTTVAKKLYFVTSFSDREDGIGEPLCAWAMQRYLYNKVQEVLSAAIAPPAEETKRDGKLQIRILVRGKKARAIVNIDELKNTLTSTFPECNVEIAKAVSGHLVENLKIFREADVLIAAHGAGLNNMFGLRPNAKVIEIGFSDAEFSWPSDYLCLARNLGLQYYGTFALSGNQLSGLHVDIEDVVNIVKQIVNDKR